MADKLKIKLSIADRVYPMSINPKQEEALRKATKSIEQMIKQFEQNYAVRDAIMADPSCFLMNEIAPGGYTPRFLGNITDTSLTIGRSCLLYTSPSPRDRQKSRMPSSA